MLATYAETAFQPYADMLHKCLDSVGIPGLVFPWAPLRRAEVLQTLLGGAGFELVDVKRLGLGYHLPKAQDWWEVIEYGELRAWIAQLPVDRLEQVRSAHLAEIATRETPEGLWLDVPIHLVSGRKPAQKG